MSDTKISSKYARITIFYQIFSFSFIANRNINEKLIFLFVLIPKDRCKQLIDFFSKHAIIKVTDFRKESLRT